MGTILKFTFCVLACVLSDGAAATGPFFKELNDQDSGMLSAFIQRIERLESRDAEHVKKEMEYQTEIGQLREEIYLQRQTIDHQQLEIDQLKSKVNGMETGDEKAGTVKKEMLQRTETHTESAGPSRRASTNYAVAFFASVAAQAVALEPNGTLIFEAVDSNESGAYNNVTGIFMAPVTGSYVFSMTITTFATFQTHVGLVRNGERLTQLWVDGQAQQYNSASQTTLLHLQKGDLVTVRQDPGTETYVEGLGHTMLTGFLLFATF